MELEQFHQEAQRLKTGRRIGSLPVPETLRAFAMRDVVLGRKNHYGSKSQRGTEVGPFSIR